MDTIRSRSTPGVLLQSSAAFALCSVMCQGACTRPVFTVKKRCQMDFRTGKESMEQTTRQTGSLSTQSRQHWGVIKASTV